MNNPSDFFVAGGTLRLSSESYVPRPADRELFERVQTGEFCYVLTPRQMGKSSLMVRTAERLKQAGYRTALIDLTGTGTTAVTADAWYQGLLTRLKMELRLNVDVQTWWAERQASSVAQRFIEFLREVVLARVSEPVAIFIDEIDSTLGLGFSDDFFAAIRYIYNERANDPAYKRLTFVLLGVATPSDLIKDQTRTPFNVGHRIDLQEFSRADAQLLANGLEASYPGYGELILSRVFHWSGGHPYLTQKLCLVAVNAPASTWDEAQVDALVETNFFSDEARNDTNLKFVQSSIQARPDLERRRILQLYEKVYRNQAIRSDERSPIQNYLTLFGLVRVAGGCLHVRNEIYRRVFDQIWIKENIPSSRQQQWAIFASLMAFVLVAITIGVILMRQTPPDIQAQICWDNFTGATSPAVQMDALACLFSLGPGYDEQARRMFYSLPPAQQKYLFLLDNPQAVGTQIETVVRGIYVTLDQMEGNQDHAIMEAMLKALKEANRPETVELTDEIRYWERGRELADQQQYAQAVISYTMAIETNKADSHPVIHYDRAMAYVALSQYDKALVDLTQVVTIARMAPPTPTPTPSKMPDTLTPTHTSTPTETPVPTNTSAAGPTASVEIAPTPVQPPPTSTPSATPEKTPSPPSLRFLNSDQIINTVGQTLLQIELLRDYFAKNQADYPQLAALFPVVTSTPTTQTTLIPTDTPTSTSMPTSTSTSLPLLAQNTPIPTDIPPTLTLTDTPTVPTVTPSPIPATSIAQAVVLAKDLNLRAGPGTVYESIGVLHQGDALEIQGRLASNEWIQVIPVKATDTLGWVAARPEYVTINVDLATLKVIVSSPLLSTTPTLVMPPPILIDPQPNASQYRNRIELEWDWPGILGPNDYFQVELRNRYNAFNSVIDETVSPIDVAWVKDKFYRYDAIDQAYDREYAWRIIVVRYLSPEESLKEKDWSVTLPQIQVWEPPTIDKIEWISQPSEMRRLFVEAGDAPPQVHATMTARSPTPTPTIQEASIIFKTPSLQPSKFVYYFGQSVEICFYLKISAKARATFTDSNRSITPWEWGSVDSNGVCELFNMSAVSLGQDKLEFEALDGSGKKAVVEFEVISK